MKSTVLAAALAVSAGAAAAGPGVTLYFDADGDAGDAGVVRAAIGESVTWTVYASFSGYDSPDAYLAGFTGEFRASDPDIGSVENIQVLTSNRGQPTSDGLTIENIDIFSTGRVVEPGSPLALMTFDATLEADGGWNYNAVGIASVFPGDGPGPDEYAAAAVVSDAVVAVPAPGALALLGIAGGVAVRRRR